MKKLLILVALSVLAACSPTAPTPVVPPANVKPVAAFTISATSGTAPLTVSVNAGSSSDSDGQVSSYLWNWGDGSGTSSGVTASHVYNQVGSYKIVLTVRDDKNASSVYQLDISVTQDSSSGSSFAKTQTERLTGKWAFTFTIIKTYTDLFTLSEVRASSVTPGQWNIFGTDTYGNKDVIASYLINRNKFDLLNLGITIDEYFQYNFSPLTSNANVSGCYYLIDKSDNSISDCYSMNGSHTSLNTLSLDDFDKSINMSRMKFAQPRNKEEVDILKRVKNLTEELQKQ